MSVYLVAMVRVDDPDVSLRTWSVEVEDGVVLVGPSGADQPRHA